MFDLQKVYISYANQYIKFMKILITRISKTLKNFFLFWVTQWNQMEHKNLTKG